ncbi:MAG TPA: hypothetical protein DEQ02_05690 [Ruminococcaceae bacterium]|nr:hypothetical protein [Oscillospiraceae bacterium]
MDNDEDNLVSFEVDEFLEDLNYEGFYDGDNPVAYEIDELLKEVESRELMEQENALILESSVQPDPEPQEDKTETSEYEPSSDTVINAELGHTENPHNEAAVSLPESTAFFNDIEFDIRFRGYDRMQVDDYIDKLSEDYNKICGICASLEEENRGLRVALAEYGMRKDGEE